MCRRHGEANASFPDRRALGASAQLCSADGCGSWAHSCPQAATRQRGRVHHVCASIPYSFCSRTSEQYLGCPGNICLETPACILHAGAKRMPTALSAIDCHPLSFFAHRFGCDWKGLRVQDGVGVWFGRGILLCVRHDSG